MGGAGTAHCLFRPTGVNFGSLSDVLKLFFDCVLYIRNQKPKQNLLLSSKLSKREDEKYVAGTARCLFRPTGVNFGTLSDVLKLFFDCVLYLRDQKAKPNFH